MSHEEQSVRLDKWLWATRFYKTRSLATEACQADHVRIEGQPAKPSRQVRAGDVIQVRLPGITRTVRVLQAADKRVGAKNLPALLEDLTPPEEYRQHEEWKRSSLAVRLKGAGRPTKKERRQMDRARRPDGL